MHYYYSQTTTPAWSNTGWLWPSANVPAQLRQSQYQVPVSASMTRTPLPLAVETALGHLVLNVPLPVRGGPTIRFQLGPSQPSLHVRASPPTEAALSIEPLVARGRQNTTCSSHEAL